MKKKPKPGSIAWQEEMMKDFESKEDLKEEEKEQYKSEKVED